MVDIVCVADDIQVKFCADCVEARLAVCRLRGKALLVLSDNIRIHC